VVEPNELWYHYKENADGNFYELTINPSEKELIKIIEEYSGCNFLEIRLKDEVLKKDKRNRSNGLMWHILNHLKSFGKQKGFDWKWVINNIENVESNDLTIKIIGRASPYK
jgi:hypothetical protein